MKFNRDWLIVGGLLLLSLVPTLGGIFRIMKIEAGDTSLENARFLASPIPILGHIIAATIYSFAGAIQFAPGLRKKWPRWHRIAGGGLILLAIVVAATGLWMTLFYPAANHDGFAVFAIRVLVGLAMLMFIGRGVLAIKNKKFVEHGQWMIRTYALAMGAGTHVLTHMPWLFVPSMLGENTRAISLILGWAINLLVAEWIIIRTSKAGPLDWSNVRY